MIFHVLFYTLSGTLLVIGLFMCIICSNFIKKLIGLATFQSSVCIMYIGFGFIENSKIPIIKSGTQQYSSPLAHVLILTAIVVGISVLSLGLSMTVKIWQKYSSVEDNDFH